MESYAVSKKRQSVLYILMLLIFVGFFAAEIAYPSERSESMKLQNITYQGKFIWHKSDGTQEVIKVPGMKVYQAWLFQYILFCLEEFHCRNKTI